MRKILRFLVPARFALVPALALFFFAKPPVAHAAGLLDAVSGFASSLFNIALTPIALFILTLAGWILGLVGVFFNWVIIRTVFQFGLYFGTTEGMLIAWGVMRDVANIGLLFAFIFMGVLLILNVEGGGHGHGGGISARRAIPRLIMFAVLLNFSLFASQAVIDVANALGSQFAGLAGMDKCISAETTTQDCANYGISGKVMHMAGIQTVWNDGISTDGVVYMGLAMFVMITSMVLLAAAVMLIVRVVILTLLMITSPIGFAGMVIPGLGGLAKQWWHNLISQSFFAPAMLLLMFISLKVAENLNPNGTTIVAALAGNNAQSAGNLQVLVVFAVVIGLMLASLTIASKMGAMGAKFATGAASAATVGLTLGATTRATNFVAGGLAYRARTFQQRTGLGGRAGEVAVNRLLRPLENANLDLRRIGGVSAGMQAAGISGGTKPLDHASFADQRHQFQEIMAGTHSQELEQQYRNEVNKRAVEDEAHALGENGGQLSDANQRYLASLTTKELEELHGIKDGIAGLAQNLSPEQFENLMKSDKLSEQQKDTLRNQRFSGVRRQFEQAQAGDADARANLRRWTAKDLAELGRSEEHGDLLNDAEFAGMLTTDQYDGLMKSERLGRAQQVQLRARRNERLTDPTRTATTLARMSTADVSKLDAEVVAQRHVLARMTGVQLAHIDTSKLNPTEMATVTGYIRGMRGRRRQEFDNLVQLNREAAKNWAGKI